MTVGAIAPSILAAPLALPPVALAALDHLGQPGIGLAPIPLPALGLAPVALLVWHDPPLLTQSVTGSRKRPPASSPFTQRISAGKSP